MSVSQTVGFIGGGQMATAIIRGLLARGFTQASSIYVSDISESRLTLASKLGLSARSSNVDVASLASTVILAVKPNNFPTVLPEIKSAVGAHKPVVSIAGGLSLDTIEAQLQSGARVVRAMPNVSASVLQSVTAIAAGRYATASDVATTQRIFDCVGQTVDMKESLFDAFAGIAGCGTAFMMQVIDAMADAGVLLGIGRQQAIALAAQMMAGSGTLVLKSGQHPAELKDSVCSPGGSTIEGVKVLEERGVRAAFIGAVIAAAEKG
jgi:pyrroline-5-carboxylate reductase